MISRENSDKGMATIVTITPIAVEKDSRTYKQAASLTRFGYTSIVVEGESSGFERMGLPFELRSLRKGSSEKAVVEPSRENKSGQQGARERLIGWLKRTPLRMISGLLRFVARYVYWYGLYSVLHTPKASLYYLHAFYQFPAVYILSRLYKVPYIYDAHDFYSSINQTETLTPLQKYVTNPFERWLEAICVKNAAAVVTVADGIAKLQQDAFARRGVVVRNCQDLRIHTEPSQRLRDRLGIAANEFLFVVVGQAKEGQAIEEMLVAMSNLPAKVHVALLGSRYEQYQAAIEKLNLEKRVHIVPPVKPMEVVPFIQTADASLILYYPYSANYLNALPNGFFQAIVAGLPILYPQKLPEIKKIAEQYGFGLPIDPQSPESLRSAVIKLMQEPQRLSEYKENAQRASQVLNWQQEEQILRDLIHKILNEKDTSP